MQNTIVFVTNQFSCDRIIAAGKEIADSTSTELMVVGIMNQEYKLDPKAVDYLFARSKEHGATMNLIFKEEKEDVMGDMVGQYTCRYVVTGMPSSNQSVVYGLWKNFPEKDFFTVDTTGNIVTVASAVAAFASE